MDSREVKRKEKLNQKKMKREEKLNNKRIKTMKKYEKLFSAHKYSGKGKKNIETFKGKSVVTVAAPHSVDFFEDGNKPADAYSGGLTRLLAGEVGCHAIYLRKSYDEIQKQTLIDEVGAYINQNQLKVLVDMQLVDSTDETVIFLERENTVDDKYGFLQRAIKYSFEYMYRNQNILKVVSDTFDVHNSVTSDAADNAGIAHIYLGINKKYITPVDKKRFAFFYAVLLETITMLSNLDWDAEKIKVYKLWQSGVHKPQDKIEISFGGENTDFDDESLLNICTYGLELEKVRLHSPNAKTIDELKKSVSDTVIENEYIFLTNRLIEILFGREWIEGKESEPGLREAPIIVYSNKKEVYPIGLPKANQIDGVFFSSALYEEKQNEAELFDYVIFNRYSDSRLHIDYEELDYADYGRVKTDDGQPAKKVMIPRYYKRLLGYLDYPLKMIRKEEYDGIIKRLGTEEKKAFEACYEKIDGEIFYRAKSIFISDENGESEADKNPEDKKIKDTVIAVQNRCGLYNNVEILRIPKEVKPEEKLLKRIMHKLDKIKISILKKAIGKSEYLLKTEWTSETDDRNNIARLSPNMMSLLGVSEDDKILVKFGRKQEILRVLADDELTDYQIGIPAPARKKLGMNSVNDIVIVHRDMVHIFWRHSEEQTIAILGTVLAVFQVITQIWVGVLLCLIVTPLIMYFVLNEERVKVK